MPKMMTGHCRIFTHELSCSVANQIPAPMIGIDRSMATKLIAPMTLLLRAISDEDGKFYEDFFGGLFGKRLE